MAKIGFTEQHEWVRIEGDTATIGITPYAAGQLGDVVFVELPEVGKRVKQFGEAAVVESVKAASEVYAPISGEVVAVNDALAETPALVNEGPMEGGWFVKIKVSDAGEFAKLMTEAQYTSFLEGLS